MFTPPSIVILAAGIKPRPAAGGPAQALPSDGGSPLGQTIDRALETGWPVCVVLTPEWVPWAAPSVATRDLVVLDDARAQRGLGHAIAAGVAAHAAAPGWLLLPGDMPQVMPESIFAVGRALAGHPAAYAQHHGRPGHPLGFAAELYSELTSLDGDVGARRLLARYPAAAVEVQDPGVLRDAEGSGRLPSLSTATASAKGERPG